jgi:glycine/D-amino acid oxidase-like deaminating enzyme
MSHTQRQLRSGQPIWLRHALPIQLTYPVLAGRLQTDVAIVGGGMTGALVAQAFAEADVSVVLLEAAHVGSGSTAASSALLLQEPDLGLEELRQRYGAATSRRLWRLSHDAVGELIALLHRLEIRCDLSKRDAIYYAMRGDSVEKLRREFELRAKAGFEGRWLSPGKLRELTAIPGRGAIRTRGGAQFDPYRACLGVLRAAAASGAQIFERTPVTRIDAARDRVRLRTPRGSVDARRVVVATGYATPYFRPLAGRFRMFRTYVLATEPMTASERAEVGLSDVMVWDTARPYHYARWTEDHRLLLGGADRAIRVGQRPDLLFKAATRELRDYFEAMLPALSAIDIEAAWEGLFAMTPDSLPYIGPHPRYPGHWFALGYGGNGMTFGLLSARLLLERWQSVKSVDQSLFAFHR